MHILALNASPRKTRGNTHRILAPFLEGAEQAGATAETIMVRDLTVNACTGCMSCWFKTPKQCVQEDDMADVLEKVQSAEVLVLGSAVYVDGMVGALKVVLDRMVPFLEPELIMLDGHMRHAAYTDRLWSKVVLVSACGLHEMDNFDPLVAHVEAICRNLASEYVGGLLRPHAHALDALARLGCPATPVFDACREAGRQLVTQGRIEQSVLDQVSQELMPPEMYMNGANETARKLMAKFGAA